MTGWVKVAEGPNGLWVALLRTYLENAGIPVWVENEHTQAVFGAGLLGSPNPAVGPLRLWVPQRYEQEALRLIEVFFAL
ncbi:MAG: hypothetical protein KatS3mg026_0754 [Bacteroidia bacterium]|nr:MAG: hypothetical protein KatS3mg026_0754 [Bacteroidia bacterium]